MGVCAWCKKEKFVSDLGICLDCEAEWKVGEKFKNPLGIDWEELMELLDKVRDREEEVTQSIDKVVDQVVKEMQEESGKRTGYGICRKCGRKMHLKARGLCGKCWGEEVGDLRVKRRSVSVDFSDYPELFEALEKDAKENFRPVSMHVLWILNQYLGEKDAGSNSP